MPNAIELYKNMPYRLVLKLLPKNEDSVPVSRIREMKGEMDSWKETAERETYIKKEEASPTNRHVVSIPCGAYAAINQKTKKEDESKDGPLRWF